MNRRISRDASGVGAARALAFAPAARALAGGRAVWCSLVLLLLGACSEKRDEARAPVPTYSELAPMLERACGACHGADRAEGGYSVAPYLAAIGCTDDGRAVLDAREGRAFLEEVLERKGHRSLLTEAEHERLRAWLRAGAPAARRVLHAQGILDPRSPDWHGKLASLDRFRALRDADADAACGRCHRGAPATPPGKLGNTDGATACTACHREPGGVFACSTCHGQAGRAHPPRDACYFGGSARDPHAVHLGESQLRSEGFGCDTCHPVPQGDLFSGPHADGKVDVRFASPLLDAEASYHADDGSCSVACHARMGERSEPVWEVDAPLDCQSCHKSPPDQHPPGACSTCHTNMGSTPDSLRIDALHMDGKVDVGDGKGTCGSCHGHDETGAPADVAHAQHLGTALTRAIACSTCHPTPTLDDLRSTEHHMNGRVDVALSGRAHREDRTAHYDATLGSCAQVACHGEERVDFRWGLPSQASSACTACHATPPPPPHATLPGCGGGLCHGGEVASDSAGLRITESGRALHIDGTLQAGGR